jgi:cytoskeletal protein CcmA (bactofilin family)
MFGNQAKKENSMAGNNGSPSSKNTINSLGFGTRLEGTLSADNDIRIDGELVGLLNCKGKVIIGAKGFVDGELNCQNAVVEGKFKGKLKVHELLNVRDSAQVHGDVSTKQLLVQSGAIFNVTCDMGNLGLKKSKNVGKEEALLSLTDSQ